MFGFVMADIKELTPEEDIRYRQFYCGICRQMRLRHGSLARLGLSFDLAFLGLLLHSLYEPEETTGKKACGMHPIKPRPWVDNAFVRYAADMNIALAYYNLMDDWQDDRKLSAKLLAASFQQVLPELEVRYPRQCGAIADCLARLHRLEQENCDDADLCANCFGTLMGELLVYEEDLWAPTLRKMGMALGRFIYLADAAVDYRRDAKKGNYNPFIAANTGFAPGKWEQYLVLAMGRCTREFEKLLPEGVRYIPVPMKRGAREIPAISAAPEQETSSFPSGRVKCRSAKRRIAPWGSRETGAMWATNAPKGPIRRR